MAGRTKIVYGDELQLINDNDGPVLVILDGVLYPNPVQIIHPEWEIVDPDIHESLSYTPDFKRGQFAVEVEDYEYEGEDNGTT